MNCNLVKRVVKKDINGETVSFVHYYLKFNNNKIVRVCAEWIKSDNVKDAQKAESIKESNKYNATLLDAYADLEQ